MTITNSPLVGESKRSGHFIDQQVIRKTSAKNEEDYGRSRVFDSCPLLMEQSSSANKTGNINRLFQALCLNIFI